MEPQLFSTRLTEMFEVPHPIAAGGMMWLSTAGFIAAVARGGAMGFMTPRSYGAPEAFREGLAECIALADGNPVGVNLTIPRYHATSAPNREYLAIALDQGVRMFETAGAHPGDLIEAIHAGGGRVMHKATQFRHALAAERDGADAVVIVGMEAGGHPGLNPHPAPVLLAHLRPKLRVPLAIGGGMGTGRQLAGMLAMGAEAVLMGTRFLTAAQIWAHPDYKARLVAATHDDTTTAMESIKATWRVLDNATAREIRRMEAEGDPRFEDFGAVVRGTYGRDNAYMRGDAEKGLLSCSSAVGFAQGVEPAAAIVASIIAEAREALGRLDALRVAPADAAVSAA